ncbi:MAG TPA: serine hydrolase [Alcanivoracaceae bacterium]|nr:serine hydrolase [Alcanivoracaceae bacterium]
MALVSRRWLVNAITVVVLMVAIVVVWKWDEIQRLRTVSSLFAEDKLVHNFSHMDRAFLFTELPRGSSEASPLPQQLQALPLLAPWIKERGVAGLVVLKEGNVVFEGYYQGTEAADRRIGWSLAKPFLTALTGILLHEGAIESVDAQITEYLPQLKGGAYDGVTLRDVLQMTSGVSFNENFQDPKSDISEMGRVLALGGSLDEYITTLKSRHSEPGTHWQYASIDTHIAAMVLRATTHRSIADLMSEKIIQPLGVEQTPFYLVDGYGVAFVLGGLNLSTRDYARFGQMFLQQGEWNGQQVVPAEWVAASTMPQAPIEKGRTQYGYQWWIPADAQEGEFYARGVYGQYIYVNREKNVVVAVNAADLNFRGEGVREQNLAMFRQLAEEL